MRKKTNSYVENCRVKPRKEGIVPIYQDVDGNVIIKMDGYTVIPNEEFDAIVERTLQLEDQVNALTRTTH